MNAHVESLLPKAVQLARFKSIAVRFEPLAAEVVQERLDHLTAGAVVDANEQDLFSCSIYNELYRTR